MKDISKIYKQILLHQPKTIESLVCGWFSNNNNNKAAEIWHPYGEIREKNFRN